MLRGLYTAAAGMMSQQRKHDAITNNIANMQTPGYKENHAVTRSFPEMLIALMEGKSGQETINYGRLNTGVFVEEAVTIHTQGALRQTGNPLDFALVSDIQREGLIFQNGMAITEDGERIVQPQAFFTVLDLDGQERYTRNGKFSISETGELVTAEGFRVLGYDGQPLVLLDPETQAPIVQFAVNEYGQLIDPESGQALALGGQQPSQLLISQVNNPNRLIPEGYGLFRFEDGEEGGVVQAVLGGEVQVRQGFVEASNVDPAMAMVDMMTAARIYEANQKVIQTYDKSMEKAVNEIGRV